MMEQTLSYINLSSYFEYLLLPRACATLCTLALLSSAVYEYVVTVLYGTSRTIDYATTNMTR